MKTVFLLPKINFFNWLKKYTYFLIDHLLILSDIRKQPIAKGKSINLALSNRGLTALENAGIDVKSLLQISSVPMKGRMIHNENGFLDALLYDVKYKRVNIFKLIMFVK